MSEREFLKDDIFDLIETLQERVGELERYATMSTVVTYSYDNVSNPPTDAELDTAFGSPSEVGANFAGLLNDNGAGSNVYLVMSDGSNWWYEGLTKAT